MPTGASPSISRPPLRRPTILSCSGKKNGSAFRPMVWRVGFVSVIPVKAPAPRGNHRLHLVEVPASLELPPWEDDLKGLIRKDAM